MLKLSTTRFTVRLRTAKNRFLTNLRNFINFFIDVEVEMHTRTHLEWFLKEIDKVVLPKTITTLSAPTAYYLLLQTDLDNFYTKIFPSIELPVSLPYNFKVTVFYEKELEVVFKENGWCKVTLFKEYAFFKMNGPKAFERKK